MRVLIDTNILLDYLLEREPYCNDARIIIKACQQRIIYGSIAAHTVTNIFYILRKNFSIDERREILLDFCKLLDVQGIDTVKIQNSLLNKDFTDFEDCLQVECAKEFHADYIVTRNSVDFIKGSIPCVEPDRLCKMLEF